VQARKTNDEVILSLLRQGKNQSQIARALNVSSVAIHKRLKKILPPAPSLEGLTAKQRKFCELVAGGESRTSAAMRAYDVSSRESAKALQSELRDKPEIEESIKALMDYHGLTKSYRVGKLRGLVDHVDPNVSLRALDQSWRLDNAYPKEASAENKPQITFNFSKQELALIVDGLMHVPPLPGSDAPKAEEVLPGGKGDGEDDHGRD